MNFAITDLLHPLSLKTFTDEYLGKNPYACPGAAAPFLKTFSWKMLQDITAVHEDCWLVRAGELLQESGPATGKVSLNNFIDGFNSGHTLVIRHGEVAHPFLKDLANTFFQVFSAPIDIQLYVTPDSKNGFDWHYDQEDVFVLQTKGSKEFFLRKPRFDSLPPHTELPKTFKLSDYSEGPELRCLLKAGDLLYIPAGYWHKARAITTSFHISVGVMKSALRGVQ